ncbi:MAG: superoxide dismutase, partial [Planctomycetota bacterium]
MHDDTQCNDTGLDRRTAMAALAVGSAGVLTAGATGSPAAASGALAGYAVAGLTDHDLGWSVEDGAYSLPELPYAYDALEPFIDAQTMEIHHSKHHAGYVRGLNSALEQLRQIREGSGDVALVQHWTRKVAFHGGGHINHTIFWSTMKPAGDGGGRPPASGPLATRIDRDFGGFERFLGHFKAAAASVEGSGWGWLCYEPVSRKLVVTGMETQQNEIIPGSTPLLGVDVWEHAYYLKYQNRRSAYIDAFLKVVDWNAVAARFAAAAQ